MNTPVKRSVRVIVGICTASLAAFSMIGCGGSSATGANTVVSPTETVAAPAPGERVIVKESAVEIFQEATKQAKTDPKGAIETYKRAANEQKNFAEAYYNIGLLEQQLGHYDKAREAYNTVISIQPRFAAAHNNLAKMLLDEGKVEEAEQAFLKIIDEKTGIDPYNVEANLNLGLIYRKRGEEILNKELGGSEPKFSMDGAETKGEIKNKDARDAFTQAVVYIRRALAGDSNNIYCYENLASVYYIMNSLEIARLVIDQAAIKFDEYNQILAEDLAAGRISQEDFDQKAYTPKDRSTIYNTSGLIYLAEGQVSMGNAQFRRAIDIDPTNVPARLNAAGIAINVQDFQTAYDNYTKVLELEPNNLVAYLSKGVAARGLGQIAEAEGIYDDIIKNHPEYPQAQFNKIILTQEYKLNSPENLDEQGNPILTLDSVREMWEKFSNDPTANKVIPGRVAEAKARIVQIDEQKRKMKEAADKQAAIERRLAEAEARMKAAEEAERAAEEAERAAAEAAAAEAAAAENPDAAPAE